MRTFNAIIKEITDEYLDTITLSNTNPSPEDIENELLTLITDAIVIENIARKGEKASRLTAPKTLLPAQIAMILKRLHFVKVIALTEIENRDYNLLGIYQPDGDNKGLYVTDEDTLFNIARKYNFSLNSNDMKEISAILKSETEIVSRCSNRDLIAVNNGIFNYKTKELLPFTPELVFLSKSHVDFNEKAVNIIIHNNDDNTDWDIESWFKTLSDDDEIIKLLWEIVGAVIRPNVRWEKTAWLYSETGNNGKGTLCQLIRNLCGTQSCTSITLSDFSKDFMLEPLIRASAIVTDENDVGTYIDQSANLKAIITGDPIQINRKHKAPISYQFYGFMVQCLNEFPRIKDRSESFSRRQLFIPMTKCFTGHVRGYIKSDYLGRKDVLEYVLYKILNTNYYELSNPQASQIVLQQYMEFNDPVRQFFSDIIDDKCQWDLLPFTFLYTLYKPWLKENVPQGIPLGKNKFITEIKNLTIKSDNWLYQGDSPIRRLSLMDKPEPLILQYNLDEWKNPTYTGKDEDKICSPKLNDQYRGILRRT